MKKNLLFFLGIILCLSVRSQELSDADRTLRDAFIGHMEEFASGLDAEKMRTKLKEGGPEAFCWVEFRYLNGLLTAHELTGDLKQLERFREGFAAFEALLEEGPDGYRGWYGPTLKNRQPAENPGLEVDEIQTNFRAIGILARWVELARRDETYAAEQEETIDRYLKLMEEQLFPKWDARDHFVVIPGRGGVYRWLDYPIREGASLSFEKLSILVEGLLNLYRVTDNPVYMKRALQIGAWYKENLSLVDGHYEWMSWVPGGKWDMDPEKDDAWRVGWMAPDPNAAWYIASVSIAVNLYRHGVLFDEIDIERFVKTQKEMCWNGDLENPVYRSVSGGTGKWIKGRFLSPQLANYDPVIRQLAFAGPHEAEQLENAENSWKGGANAEMYIREKFVVKDPPQPYASFGEKFKSDPVSGAFLDQLSGELRWRGKYPPPLKPSVWYVNPFGGGEDAE